MGGVVLYYTMCPTPLSVNSFIKSLNKCSLSIYYMPGTFPVVSKETKILLYYYILLSERNSIVYK